MEHSARGDHEAQPAVVDARPAAVADVLALELARDTGGQVQPRYQFVPRTAGRLACGELVIEPALGPVRVVLVLPARGDHGGRSAYVHVTWSDDHGPCRAAGRYPADRALPVRAPHYGDRLLIRQALDQAAWKRRDVPGQIVRLIAAHLHLGPHSALYGFTINGEVTDHLYDELNQVSTSWQAYRPWAAALTRYCVNRQDTGPVPGWGPDDPDSEQVPTASAEPTAQPNGRQRIETPKPPLAARKRLPTDMALKLMDAAFALGVTAGRTAFTTTHMQQLLQEHTSPAA